MTSVARVLANRSNAQKSTGPRTPQGKAVVAQNAVRHGLCAARVVIKGEDPGEFELYRERMLGDLEPVGSVENMLAERIANLGWRLQRAERLEGAAWATLEAKQVASSAAGPAAFLRPAGVALAETDEEAVLGQIVVKDFGEARVLDQLLVYERRIESSLYRTMGELRKQQVLRALKAAEDASRSEYRLQAGQESSLPTSVHLRPPEGGTPNGRTNAALPPAEQSQLPNPPSLAASHFTRPTRDELPHDGTTNTAEGTSCETNPKKEEGVRCTPYRPPTAAETPCGVTANGTQSAEPGCETKPMGNREN
jgi:hypothetical protein